jgi:hypothetical protein
MTKKAKQEAGIVKLSRAETIYSKLADALFSLDPAETVGRARARILGSATVEELAAVAALVEEKRALYAVD